MKCLFSMTREQLVETILNTDPKQDKNKLNKMYFKTLRKKIIELQKMA